MGVPHYGIPLYIEDIADYELDDLFDEEKIQPEQNKQSMPKPPTYEESLADKINKRSATSIC